MIIMCFSSACAREASSGRPGDRRSRGSCQHLVFDACVCLLACLRYRRLVVSYAQRSCQHTLMRLLCATRLVARAARGVSACAPVVHICIYIHTYIHTYIHIYIYIYIFVFAARGLRRTPTRRRTDPEQVAVGKRVALHARRLLLRPPLCLTANLRTKILDLRGLDSGRILILRGGIPRSIGNSRMCESSNLGRDNRSREIGRSPSRTLTHSACAWPSRLAPTPSPRAHPYPYTYIHVNMYICMYIYIYSIYPNARPWPRATLAPSPDA